MYEVCTLTAQEAAWSLRLALFAFSLGLAFCLPFRLLQLSGLSYFPPACHFQFAIRLRCLDALLLHCSFLCIHEKPTVLLVRRLLLCRLSIHLTTPTLRFLPSQFSSSCCCNLSISRYLYRPNRQDLLSSSYLITLAASTCREIAEPRGHRHRQEEAQIFKTSPLLDSAPYPRRLLIQRAPTRGFLGAGLDTANSHSHSPSHRPFSNSAFPKLSPYA